MINSRFNKKCIIFRKVRLMFEILGGMLRLQTSVLLFATVQVPNPGEQKIVSMTAKNNIFFQCHVEISRFTTKLINVPWFIFSEGIGFYHKPYWWVNCDNCFTTSIEFAKWFSVVTCN